MIRNAENFIYIENQYFLGSAYAWLNDFETNADHPIPAEIAQKVKLEPGSLCCQAQLWDKRLFGINALSNHSLQLRKYCLTGWIILVYLC